MKIRYINYYVCPSCSNEWEELFDDERVDSCPDCGYGACPISTDKSILDDLGGVHEGGVGYSPDGKFCGECSFIACEGCVVLK